MNVNSTIITKIECCLQLVDKPTPHERAEQFKKFVLKVVATDQIEFHAFNLTDTVYAMLDRGESENEIMNACF
jgi:hypothetical protein